VGKKEWPILRYSYRMWWESVNNNYFHASEFFLKRIVFSQLVKKCSFFMHKPKRSLSDLLLKADKESYHDH
jgi:hypothetical protein